MFEGFFQIRNKKTESPIKLQLQRFEKLLGTSVSFHNDTIVNEKLRTKNT